MMLSYGQPLPRDATADLRLLVPVGRLPDACAAVTADPSARLVTMVGLDDRVVSNTFRLVYLFRRAEGTVSIETELPANEPVFPSVTPSMPAAHWYEREVHDLLGLRPEGHPDLRRLVLHEPWPMDDHPLLKDFVPSSTKEAGDASPYHFHNLHGDGIVEIPVGPIHAGVIEPGHFRFAAVGELVLHLEARLFYTHRGLEKLAEGRTPSMTLPLAERVCGACAASHAVSFCQAVEGIAVVSVSPRAAAIRTVFLELERLYNHIGDIGNFGAGTAFMVGSMRGARLKEMLQQLNERLAGSRFLRNFCVPGGVRRDLDASAVSDAKQTLSTAEKDFDDLAKTLLRTGSFIERLRGTGILPRVAAWELGAVGIAARASGIAVDARTDAPHAYYPHLKVEAITATQGDVEARFLVRLAETTASFGFVRKILAHLPDGPLVVPLPPLPPYRAGVGITESPRGENVHWVRSGANGEIDRWRVRSASYPNWPVVALSVPGNMVPDFPLINKSFELCYSCLDR